MGKYLYNGIELPALPDWDKETYPYAIIGYSATAGTFTLTFASTIDTPVKKASYATSTSPYGQPGYIWLMYNETEINYLLTDGEWVYSADGRITTRLVWVNPADIYYSDSAKDADGNSLAGVIALAASDPIPVGSAPDVEPKAFMAGWRMGQFIRGMRG